MSTTFASYQFVLLILGLLQSEKVDDFGDLGRKLLGGFVAGVFVAIAFALIRIKLREKHPPAKFISVIPTSGADEQTGAEQ